jgi:mono/diheme cytochrome c family protein
MHATRWGRETADVRLPGTALRVLALALGALAMASPAAAGVELVETLDLDDAAAAGAAIGLAVPGAGPTVTRESALNTLLTGEVESSLLGGTPPGEPRLQLGGGGPPRVAVVLPPTGTTPNDVRYPIVLARSTAASPSVLTSDSTRITGLVSLADVANGELRTVDVDDPVAVLERLERRIDRNDRIRLPVTILLLVIATVVALLRPSLGPRTVLLALALNLWLAGWWAVALVSVAIVVLPLGFACAAVVTGYALVLGLDPEAVALSPLGPSQAGRFYGLSNLLATALLLPMLVGPALLGRVGLALAALSIAAVGAAELGADGGGLLVLLAGYATLGLRLAHRPVTPRLVLGVGGAAVVGAVVLVAIDAALGGASHVTAAVGDGPAALAGDLADRVELSARRLLESPWALVVAVVGLSGLAAVALRTPRHPVTDATLVALAVSLVVNDTPADVLAVGVVVVLVTRRYEEGSPDHTGDGLVRLPTMRRTTAALALVLALLALGVSGCTDGEEVGATPETVVGEIPTDSGSSEDLPALELEGDAAAGEAVFASGGCASCHTLAAADASGTVGPNLDESKPSYELAVERVTNGQGGMPAFGEQLEPQQIADVSQFIVESTGG